MANKLGQLTADVDSKVVLLSSAVGNMPEIFASDNDVNMVWNALEVLEHT